MAGIITISSGHDASYPSATEMLRSELSNADHLGVLSSIWYDLTRREQTTRFERLLRANLAPGDAANALRDPASTWLWRTLREAEAGGMNAGEVLRSAFAERSLDGAEHVARVIDARIRRTTAHAVPPCRNAVGCAGAAGSRP